MREASSSWADRQPPPQPLSERRERERNRDKTYIYIYTCGPCGATIVTPADQSLLSVKSTVIYVQHAFSLARTVIHVSELIAQKVPGRISDTMSPARPEQHFMRSKPKPSSNKSRPVATRRFVFELNTSASSVWRSTSDLHFCKLKQLYQQNLFIHSATLDGRVVTDRRVGCLSSQFKGDFVQKV